MNATSLVGLVQSDSPLSLATPTSAGDQPIQANPMPIIIAIICIFLLIATFVIFMALCQPSVLAESRHVAPSGRCRPSRGCSGATGAGCQPMPCEPGDASEPRLTVWKRLGSLRASVAGSFRRVRVRNVAHGAGHGGTPHGAANIDAGCVGASVGAGSLYGASDVATCLGVTTHGAASQSGATHGATPHSAGHGANRGAGQGAGDVSTTHGTTSPGATTHGGTSHGATTLSTSHGTNQGTSDVSTSHGATAHGGTTHGATSPGCTTKGGTTHGATLGASRASNSSKDPPDFTMKELATL